MSVVEFVVHGTAEPAGSKKAFVGKDGRAKVVDANPRTRAWKDRVAQVAGEAFSGELLDGPLSVTFVFYVPRPKGHYGTGRNVGVLKRSAPPYPTTRPDLLKLARGVEDAMTGTVYRDDAQIVREFLEKRYGNARVEVRVERILDRPALELAA